MINGTAYAWEHITIKLDGDTMIDIESVEYDAERDAELVYGKGVIARGTRRKRLAGKGKLVIFREQFEALANHPNIKKFGWLAAPAFTVIASYDKGDGSATTDELQDCIFTGIKPTGAKENSDGVTVEIPFIFNNGKLADVPLIEQ